MSSRASIVFTLFLQLALGTSIIHAQQHPDFFTQLQEEEQNAINALVLYPSTTRAAILEICLHPEALIKLESIQVRTQNDFLKIVDPLSQEGKAIIWDLARYPNLIRRLLGIASADELATRKVLEDYPTEVHQNALIANRKHTGTLVKVFALQSAADDAFEKVLIDYPEQTQEQFRSLLNLPEVLELLTQHIRLSIMVGDLYRKQPEWVLQKADSLNLVVAQQNIEELSDWKSQLEENPELAEQLEASTRAYVEEYTYDDEYYDFEYREQKEIPIVERHYYHYPYWFGYPTWYDYSYWRPIPTWCRWGFYWGADHTLIVYGLPSYHFVDWYFYHPHHHIWWPRLSARFVTHYHFHRRSNSSIVTGVTSWRVRNETVISDEWVGSVEREPNHFEEYGRFEANRQRYNRRHPNRRMTSTEYLDRNPRSYDRLQQSRQQQIRSISETPNLNRTRVRESEATRQYSTQPSRMERQSVRTRGEETPSSRARGQEHHRNTWERTRTTRPIPRTSTTKPRVDRSTRTKPSKPSRTTLSRQRQSSPTKPGHSTKAKKRKPGGGES
ncbi:MAG: hypothetical protein AAFQ37_02430 [Bacteroidota bacterium]